MEWVYLWKPWEKKLLGSLHISKSLQYELPMTPCEQFAVTDATVNLKKQPSYNIETSAKKCPCLKAKILYMKCSCSILSILRCFINLCFMVNIYPEYQSCRGFGAWSLWIKWISNIFLIQAFRGFWILRLDIL